MKRPVEILLVEDNPADVRLTRAPQRYGYARLEQLMTAMRYRPEPAAPVGASP